MKKAASFNKILQAALSYAARGWPVIPLHTPTNSGCSCGRKDCTSPGKHPRTKNGLKDATTDARTIERWWDNWPEANIGVVTGVVSGLFVMDVDSKEAEDLIQSRGMPDTPQATTGKGTHYYLKHPGDHVSNKVNSELGLDVRGDGGYVVAPPSMHLNGKRYKWLPLLSPKHTEPQAPAPWVLEYIGQDEKPDTDKSHEWYLEALQGVGAGSRNQTAASLAGRFIAKGLEDEEVTSILLTWNKENRPPLPRAEILRTVKSVKATHERNQRHEEIPVNLGSTGDQNSKKRPSHADMLVGIGSGSEVRLFHDQTGRSFAYVQEAGYRANWPLLGRNFKNFLSKKFFDQTGKAPARDALRQALPVLEATAQFKREQIRLNNRIAWRDGAIYYDLADKLGRMIKVSPGNWKVLGETADQDLPILFRRYEHQEAQVVPNREKPDLERLLKYLNLRDEDQKLLLLIYIISCFIPEIPHPIMVIHGPQGAAKSTTTKIIRRLVDPSVNDIQTLTSKTDQTVQSLAQNWFCAFDNISHINEETSDLLCRASTGGTHSRRQLYTDEDMLTIELQTCVSLNGINVVVSKADLMDRALLFEGARIPESERKEVRHLMAEIDRDRPRILAGIFDILAKAMEIEPTLKNAKLPRMADFARWGRAISEAMGVGDEMFLNLYEANIAQQHEEILAANPVGTALLTLMGNRSEWHGLISELLSKLEDLCEGLGIDRRSRFWPGAPHILTRRIKELEATLAGVGILVELKRSNRGRTITLVKSDGTEQKVASLTTPQDHWNNESGAPSDATHLPRGADTLNIPSFSLGPQKKEKGYIYVPPKSPGSFTGDTSVTPDHEASLSGIPSEERPNPESCGSCQHFKPDPLWPRCELVKGNRNVSHLNRCPLSENSRRRIKAAR